MVKQVSNCCNSHYEVQGGAGYCAVFYVCKKCGKICKLKIIKNKIKNG